MYVSTSKNFKNKKKSNFVTFCNFVFHNLQKKIINNTNYIRILQSNKLYELQILTWFYIKIFIFYFFKLIRY